jgi:deoxyribodipyrimidine photo-lyase
VDVVFAHREHAPKEKLEEDNLRERLKVPLRLCDGNSLLKETELPFSLVDLPQVFSKFRKQVEKEVQISRPIPVPKILPPHPQDCPPGIIPNLEDLGFEPFIRDIRSVYRFAGGETAALSRVQHYLWKSHAIKTYKETRNGMLKADDSAKLSPWLALGCLSPKHVYQEVRRYENDVVANDSTYWLIFELWWREYFRWITRLHGDKLFRSGGIRNQSSKVEHWEKWLEAWCQGETGVPFVDAHMRKLKATGYMSNRGRQNVASFLVRDLRQDWRLGAAYFESRLIDYDVHSNWGNWNYVAGVGNDPREDRYFNLVTQTLRYDPNGEFIIRWVPELRDVPPKEIPHIVQFNRQQRKKYRLGAYPEPIVFSQAWRR